MSLRRKLMHQLWLLFQDREVSWEKKTGLFMKCTSCNCVSMRPALRFLAPAAVLSRCVLPPAFASARLQPVTSRSFASIPYAGASFDSAVNDLPYADFLRVPESDVLLDARHTKRQVGAAALSFCFSHEHMFSFFIMQVDACVRGLKECVEA
jgi:hypothetical protein